MKIPHTNEETIYKTVLYVEKLLRHFNISINTD